MAKSVFDAPHFQSEPAAFAYVEARLWPRGPVCPRCQGTARIGKLTGVRSKPSKRNPEGVEQHGLYKCYACQKPFTVRIGTIFEDSHVPLHLWLQIIHLMCCSKKGIATRQIQRMLQCSMKTAWHLGHRIRLAMDPGQDAPMGGEGKTVEIDDMEIGRSHKTRRHPQGRRANIKVLSLVERGGPIRSIVLDHRGIGPRLYQHLDRHSRLVSDSAPVFKGQVYGNHEAVDHSKYEWARGDVHTNTLEGFFSIFKRGIIGIYQHVESQHFARYLAEFDFRQNTRERLGINDGRRAEIALQGVKGKRLMYRDSFAE